MKRLVEISTIPAREVFTYVGQKFIALEHTKSGTVVVTDECIGQRAFDESDSGNEIHNDWKTSTLKQWLNEDFLKKLIGAGADLTAFYPMLLDLTADDGLDDYGTDKSRVGLLSVDAYKKYRKLLEPISASWWTITPYSTKSNGYSCYVRGVDSDGALTNDNAYNGGNGVRPLFSLQSSILVSK